MSIQSGMSVLSFSSAQDLGRAKHAAKSNMLEKPTHHAHHASKIGDPLRLTFDNTQEEDENDYSTAYETAPQVDAKSAWENQTDKSAKVQVLKQRLPLRPQSEFVYDPWVDPTALLSVEGVRTLNAEVVDPATGKLRNSQWEDSLDPRNMFRFALKCPLKSHKYRFVRFALRRAISRFCQKAEVKVHRSHHLFDSAVFSCACAAISATARSRSP